MNSMNQVQEPSGLYKGVDLLGKLVGAAAVILGTPLVYGATKYLLYAYLAQNWGRDLAVYLMWAMGFIEAYLIYALVSFIVTAGVIWGLAKLAARGFGKG
jgi:hypothetical protein